MSERDSISEQLNAYARRVADRLFRHFPDWAQLATTDPHPNADPGALLIEVVAKSNNTEHGLYVSTDGDELTIGFHTHHCHFADYHQKGCDIHIENAIEYINQLINEEYVIHSWYRGGQFCGSVTGTPESVGDPSQFVGSVDTITCRSWAGTHDSDDVKANC